MTPDALRDSAVKVAKTVPLLAGVALVSWGMGAVLFTSLALGSWRYARWRDSQ
jgi:hypothetical protein